MSTLKAERIQALYNLLIEEPDGVTIEDIAHELDIDIMQARWLIHDFRIHFGAEEEINLICDPQGQRLPWIYRLVGAQEDALPWMRNRMADYDSRAETMHAVAASVERAEPAGSRGRRYARIWRRGLERIREDLAELDGQPTG